MTRTTTRAGRALRLALPALLLAALGLNGVAAAPAGAAGPTPVVVDGTRHGGDTVALTFDDGPDPANTWQLLRVLREHRVKAVFCLWGDHVREHPRLVRAIVAAGHQLCNHSMHHDDMGTWTPDRIRADLAETSALIREVAPGAPIRWFRAPYGSWGKTPQVAAELGMQPLGWRLAVGDWDPPGTDELVARLEQATPGSVVLLHDGGGDRGQTVEAVDRIIPVYRERGWRFDLPARRG